MEKFSWQTETGIKVNSNKSDLFVLNTDVTDKFDSFLQQNKMKINILPLESKYYAEISEFYLNHGSDESESVFHLDINFLHRLSNLKCLLFVLIKQKLILGCAIAIILPIKVQRKNMESISNNIHTSFLCIHQKHRNKGLAGILIRSIIDYGFHHYQEYRTFTGIHILQEPKYNCPKITLYNCDINNVHNSIIDNSNNIDLHISQINSKHNSSLIKKVIDFLIQDEKEILFYPSEQYFIQWCKTFDTYLVYMLDEIICTFSVMYLEIISKSSVNKVAFLVLFKLNSKLNFLNITENSKYQLIIQKLATYLVDICKTNFISELIIPCLNEMNSDLLLELKATKSEMYSYYGTFNFNFPIDINNILYPYL